MKYNNYTLIDKLMENRECSSFFWYCKMILVAMVAIGILPVALFKQFAMDEVRPFGYIYLETLSCNYHFENDEVHIFDNISESENALLTGRRRKASFFYPLSKETSSIME